MTDIGSTITERLLADAGVGAGMRVLDVGCGRGDVALLVARRVGERGHVFGLDRDPQAIAAAQARIAESGPANLEFITGDLGAVPAQCVELDAVVGRRVLMYQPDAVAAVRGLVRALRPGGLVVFQEHDTTMVPASRPALPLHERVHRWMWQTVAREGGNLHMGFDLPGVLAAAGLVDVQVRAEAIVQTPGVLYGGASIVRAMLPRIVHAGVATAAEIDVDTLDERLLAERSAANATYIGDMVFGGWARKPA